MDQAKPDPRRGRPKTRNRAHVLEAAMHAYWQDSTGDISVNSICTLAGVSKPSLYRDFGSEDGLTAAVLLRYAEVVLAGMEDLLASPLSFAAKCEALIHFASADPKMETGCLFVKMKATRSGFGAQTQARITTIEENALRIYTRFFSDGATSGEWKRGIVPELAARYLHEQIGLAVTQRAAGKNPESVRELLDLAISALR